MYDHPPAGESRKAKHKFYVSLGNGGVYPSNRNLPGYEDDNPGDWRIANAEEVAAFKKGVDVVPKPAEDVVDLSEPVARAAAPAAIKLAEEDPVVAIPPVLPTEQAIGPAFSAKPKK